MAVFVTDGAAEIGRDPGLPETFGEIDQRRHASRRRAPRRASPSAIRATSCVDRSPAGPSPSRRGDDVGARWHRVRIAAQRVHRLATSIRCSVSSSRMRSMASVVGPPGPRVGLQLDQQGVVEADARPLDASRSPSRSRNTAAMIALQLVDCRPATPGGYVQLRPGVEPHRHLRASGRRRRAGAAARGSLSKRPYGRPETPEGQRVQHLVHRRSRPPISRKARTIAARSVVALESTSSSQAQPLHVPGSASNRRRLARRGVPGARGRSPASDVPRCSSAVSAIHLPRSPLVVAWRPPVHLVRSSSSGAWRSPRAPWHPLPPARFPRRGSRPARLRPRPRLRPRHPASVAARPWSCCPWLQACH